MWRYPSIDQAIRFHFVECPKVLLLNSRIFIKIVFKKRSHRPAQTAHVASRLLSCSESLVRRSCSCLTPRHDSGVRVGTWKAPQPVAIG